jgi:hypothetical protein
MYCKVVNLSEQYEKLARYEQISDTFNRYNVDMSKITKIEQKEESEGNIVDTTIFFEEPVEITFPCGQTLIINQFRECFYFKTQEFAYPECSFYLVPQTVRITSTGDTVDVVEGTVDTRKNKINLDIKPTKIHMPLTEDILLATNINLYLDFRLSEVKLVPGILNNIHLPNGDMFDYMATIENTAPSRRIFHNVVIFFYPTGGLERVSDENSPPFRVREILLADGTTEKVNGGSFYLDETGTVLTWGSLYNDKYNKKYEIKNIYHDTPNIQTENIQLKEENVKLKEENTALQARIRELEAEQSVEFK